MEMREIDHTHPHTGEPFGSQYYDAGAVAADGGRDDETTESTDTNGTTMADVDHEGTDGPVRAFRRGRERNNE